MMDVVLVPQMAGDRDIPSDVEHDDNVFDQEYMPQDVATEWEFQNNSEDDSEEGESSDSKR